MPNDLLDICLQNGAIAYSRLPYLLRVNRYEYDVVKAFDSEIEEGRFTIENKLRTGDNN